MKHDLVFERQTNLPVEQLWKAWTDPQILMKWFCPKPWRVTDCRIDLYAGGEFYTVMEGPNGEKVPGSGCYLEVIPGKKLVWTNMMGPGFQPVQLDPQDFGFVATIHFSPSYKAVVSHSDEAGLKKHQQMGFQEGWDAAFDQLVELLKNK